ncbi:MAG TPA: hypothetical protein VFN97_17660 [Actinospica sp.]|nr:hypothetical protein [Actinospica sp.]
MRVFGMVAAVGLLVGPAPGAALAASAGKAGPVWSSCRSVDLPVPTGTTESAVYGGDPSGRYLVGVGFHVGGGDGLLWVRGRLEPVNQSALTPYVQVEFDAVNSGGEIVGYRMTNETSFHTDAFFYLHGRFTLLPAPSPGDATKAVSINARGDIAGVAIGPNGWHPVKWTAASRYRTVRVLPTPGGGNAYASGIDTDGTIVGYLGSPTAATPYVWPAHGRAHALPVPRGSTDGEAYAVRDGRVVGDVLNPVTGSSELAEWNLRTGRFTTWPDIGGVALSINRRGTIGVAGGDIVHPDGRVVPVTGWVYVVTDRGTAAGTTRWGLGHAVLWIGC